MDILVTYDIATPDQAGHRRLQRVARVCEQFGDRLQYSVFECRLSDVGLERLMVMLEDEIDPSQDSVHIYPFAGSLAHARQSLGLAVKREQGTPWIL